MGDNDWIQRKLDDLKEDTHEIKQQMARMEENNKFKDHCDLLMGKRVDGLEERVGELEENSLLLKGSWKTIVAFGTLLGFVLVYFKEVFLGR